MPLKKKRSSSAASVKSKVRLAKGAKRAKAVVKSSSVRRLPRRRISAKGSDPAPLTSAGFGLDSVKDIRRMRDEWN
jgi:hypothetical protein